MIYEGPRYGGERWPTGGPSAGARALIAHWGRVYGLGSLGIYNPRPVRGTKDTPSVHGTGRAADAACDATEPTQLARGDRFAAWLIEHHQVLGVQYIIWNRRSWRCDRPASWRPYTGKAGPHRDHLHVELNRAGAANPSPLWTQEPDDMSPDQARKLDAIYDALFKGAPAVGAPPLAQTITQTGYAVAGVDLPGKPSIRTQLRSK